MDVEAVLAGVPEGYCVKGMFLARYAVGLGADWPAVATRLVAPPPGGRYHAFQDYPMQDHVRLFDTAARLRFPGSAREAYRLLSRGDVEVFATSTFGKVAFAMLRDPAAALVRFPELFHAVTKGPVARAQRMGERHVQVALERTIGTPEQVIGLLEALVLTFDETPSVEVEIQGEDGRRFSLDVRW